MLVLHRDQKEKKKRKNTLTHCYCVRVHMHVWLVSWYVGKYGKYGSCYIVYKEEPNGIVSFTCQRKDMHLLPLCNPGAVTLLLAAKATDQPLAVFRVRFALGCMCKSTCASSEHSFTI